MIQAWVGCTPPKNFEKCVFAFFKVVYDYVSTKETIKVIKSLNKTKSINVSILNWIVQQILWDFSRWTKNCRSHIYRSNSIPTLSKNYERIIFTRITAYFETILSKLLCVFRSNYVTQNALLNFLKSWQECLDNSIPIKGFWLAP